MFGQGMKGKTDFTLPPWGVLKRAAQDSDQVTMILIAAAFDGEFWKIRVSVRKGEFYDKGEQEVATYSAREDERVTVKELEPLGVTPFDLAVVRAHQIVADPPEVRNKTKSIEVINIERVTVPNPYKLTLRNASEKPVVALEVNTYRGDRMLYLSWPMSAWDHPLIEPGGSYQVLATSDGKEKSTPYGYAPELSTSIEINTVVFGDGTYEGSPYLASLI
jgi:hypothetical protein